MIQRHLLQKEEIRKERRRSEHERRHGHPRGGRRRADWEIYNAYVKKRTWLHSFWHADPFHWSRRLLETSPWWLLLVIGLVALAAWQELIQTRSWINSLLALLGRI